MQDAYLLEQLHGTVDEGILFHVQPLEHKGKDGYALVLAGWVKVSLYTHLVTH